MEKQYRNHASLRLGPTLLLKIVFHLLMCYETEGLMPDCICSEVGLQQNNCVLNY
jgi:hypothetical protein